MKSAVALLALFTGACCPGHHETEPRWGIDMMLYDPLNTDASTVDDLHRQHIRAACRVGDDRPTAMLQLCRDKGFDAVAFAPQVVSVELLKRAEQLKLPVLSAPSALPFDSVGSRNSTGS